MKISIKKSMVLILGLLGCQAAFSATEKEREALARRVSSTKLENLANTPIVVKGFGGSSWTIRPLEKATFQTGLQDILTIEVGVPPLAKLSFDMAQFKPHFAEIIEAKYIPNGTLQIYGRLRRDSAKKDEKRKETWHINQMRNYCSSMECRITQEISEPLFCSIDRIRSIQTTPVQMKPGERENFAGALDTATRITHPTTFINKTNGLIQVKGALGLSTTLQSGKTESFQTGLQDNLQIKVKADSAPGTINWKILEFNLKQIKEQFTWIKSAELVVDQSYVEQQRGGPKLGSSYTLSLNGILKRDAQLSTARMTVLRSHCGHCAIGQEQDGTISVLGIQPKK